MHSQLECSVHLASHVGYFAGVRAAICQLVTHK